MTNGRRLDAAQIIKDYDEGMPLLKIMEKHSCSMGAIYKAVPNPQRRKEKMTKHQQVLELYKQKVPLKAIAAELGYCYDSIRRILNSNECPTAPGHRRKFVEALHDKGLSIPEIAEELQYSEIYVQQTLNLAGKGKRAKKQARHLEMIRLYTEELWTVPEIAKHLGVVYTTVYRAFRKFQVPATIGYDLRNTSTRDTMKHRVNPNSKRAKVLAAVDTFKTPEQIAKEVGASLSYTLLILRDSGKLTYSKNTPVKETNHE